MHTKLILTSLSLLCGTCASAPASFTAATPSCKFANEKVEREIGFCHALRVGNTLYISGVPSPGPMEDAVPQIYRRLKKILEAHGLTFQNVVKETLYTTDMSAMQSANALRKSFYDTALPAATWVQVQQLFRPDYVLEVELVAQYPD